MPSLAVAFNITGVAAGNWILRAFAMVNGKLQHDVVGRYPRTDFHQAVTFDLFDAAIGGVVGEALRVPSHIGDVIWDGRLLGSWSDLFKKRYTIRAHFRKGDVIIDMERDVDLGYLDVGYVEPDANILLWDKWVNRMCRNVDAGMPITTGLPSYPWVADHATVWGELFAALENHIYRADEPLWTSMAPDLNVRVTGLGFLNIFEKLNPKKQESYLSLAPNASMWYAKRLIARMAY